MKQKVVYKKTGIFLQKGRARNYRIYGLFHLCKIRIYLRRLKTIKAIQIIHESLGKIYRVS